MNAMASSQLPSHSLSDQLSHYPLSDQLFQLLIAHSELQQKGPSPVAPSPEAMRDRLLWELSVLQKRQKSIAKAVAADDVPCPDSSPPTMPTPSIAAEALGRKALTIRQNLELPLCDAAEDEWDADSSRGFSPSAIAAFQSFLSTKEDACDLYSCDEFRMFEFKVKRCTRGRSHDWTECPFAHPGEKARRRDPRRFHYSGAACSEFRKGSCKKGDACEFAHGVFECWLHPTRYRTQACKDGINCLRRVCFFAHTSQQLRLLPAASAALKSPGSSRSYPITEMKYQIGSFRCRLDDQCSICAAASPQTPSPTSTLGYLPESPPCLSPPLSPTSPPHSLQLSATHLPLASLSSPLQKLGRLNSIPKLAIPSLDQTPSRNSVISAPSSPASAPFLVSSPTSRSAKAKAIAMADLVATIQQLEWMEGTTQSWQYAKSHYSSAPSKLGRTSQSVPCTPSTAPFKPARLWEADVSVNAVVGVGGGGGIQSKVYGKKEVSGEALVEVANDLFCKTYGRKELPLECGDGSPDLEWVNELVG
ncbi:hypothetical protein O6H91_06G127800 [Diphasiastrum complanatum]|uniref:Uncharacterized protein n=1 Tax=Diphasiastrum complanatum TaxID=34168 RepID=A0ACC2DIQ4_DIPCM|nr:hypothetical protein O6H91_06G127800 [Diphasiastrum complanatum]